MTKDIFVNKVEASGIIALDLIDYKPTLDIIELDIQELLFMGMIVKEKEFRALLSDIDPRAYEKKAIAFTCSTDAIIPQWTYMALAEYFQEYAAYTDFKDAETLSTELWKHNLITADLSMYKDQKVVVRTRPDIAPTLFMTATTLLKPIVKTLMYGEIGMPKVIYKK